MRVTRAVTGAVLLTVASAAALRADFRDFSNLCLAASIRTCASIQVFTTANGSNTDVVLRVRNLQGTATLGGAFDNTGGSLITRLGIVAPPIGATVGGLSILTSGAVTNVNNAESYWQLRNPGALGGMIELDASITPGSVNGGIRGCNPSAAGGITSWFDTCGVGWVEFHFTTAGLWSASQAEVAFLSQHWAVNGGGAECDTDPTTSGRHECAIVTPEPMTVLLLGSGLAGMGGVGLLRRRRNHDIENG